MGTMKRREFISLFGGAAATWPLAARSQQTAPPHTIGILVLGNPDPAPFMTAFREGLRNLGYTDKQDIRSEFRSAGEDASALNGLAAELVRPKGRHHRRLADAARAGGKPGNKGNPDRHDGGWRSGRNRPYRQLGAPGWQCHRTHRHRRRAAGQSRRTHPRDSAIHAPRDRLGQCDGPVHEAVSKRRSSRRL